jgi:hypothetical protein
MNDDEDNFDDFDQSDRDEAGLVPDLGPCCCCGRAHDNTVRTIVLLTFRAPPGYVGWGCVVCRLESAGATAVVCDDRIEQYKGEDLREHLKWIAGGQYATQRLRVPLEGFERVQFDHDLSKHPEALLGRTDI